MMNRLTAFGSSFIHQKRVGIVLPELGVTVRLGVGSFRTRT